MDFIPILTVVRGLKFMHQDKLVIIHGACIYGGADLIAGACARGMEVKVEEYPAEWDKYGRAAGPIRNMKMLKLGADLVVAFHDNLAASRGTKHMVSIAEKAGIPVWKFATVNTPQPPRVESATMGFSGER